VHRIEADKLPFRFLFSPEAHFSALEYAAGSDLVSSEIGGQVEGSENAWPDSLPKFAHFRWNVLKTIRVFLALRRALNSAVYGHLHTVEVIGSNPIAPTNSIIFNSLWPFCPAGDPITYTLFSIAYGRAIPSGDPIANTPSAPAAGRSQFRVERPNR